MFDVDSRDNKTKDLVTPFPKYFSFVEISHSLSRCLKMATRAYSVDGLGLSNTANSTVNPSTPGTQFNSYAHVITQLTYYSSRSGVNSGVDGTLTLPDCLSTNLNSVYFKPEGSPGTKVVDLRFLARFDKLYNTDAGMTGAHSCMFSFNQLIAKYLQSFYDTANAKIYNGLLNQFANGAFNQAISDPLSAYPDTTPCLFVKTSASKDIMFDTNSLLVDPVILDILTNIITSAPFNRDSDYSAIGCTYFDANTALNEQFTQGIRPNTVDLSMTSDLMMLFAHYMVDILRKTCEEYNGVDFQFTRGNSLFGVYGDNVRLSAMRIALQDENSAVNICLYAFDIFYEFIHKVMTNYNADEREWVKIFRNKVGTDSSTVLDGVAKVLLKQSYDNNYRSQPSALGMMIARSLQSNISLTDRNSVRRIVYITAVLCNSYNVNAGEVVFEKKIDDAIKQITPTNIGKVADNSQPRFIAKYDEYVSSNITSVLSQSVVISQLETGAILAARSDGTPAAGYGVNVSAKDAYAVIGHAGPGDDLKSIQSFGLRTDPDGDHVLFSSLASLLRNLTTTRNNAGGLVFAQENIADVPLYMKERFRANLPAFRSLFRKLSSQCTLIRKLADGCGLSLHRDFTKHPKPTQLLYQY
jgi:hypothetical protein